MASVVQLARQQDFCCAYCALEMSPPVTDTPAPLNMMTRDHVKALGDGGVNNARNYVAACWTCNQLKGKKSAQNFERVVKKLFTTYPDAEHLWHTLSGQERGDLEFLIVSMIMQDKYDQKPRNGLEVALTRHVKQNRTRIQRIIKRLEGG